MRLTSIPSPTSPSLHYFTLHQPFTIWGKQPWYLSKDLAMKGGGNVLSSEAGILRTVGSRTSIRAPRVHLAFQVPDDTKYFGTMGYIVMDYIDGRPLDECWNDLSQEKKIDITRQVAELVLQLQSVKLPEPRPMRRAVLRSLFYSLQRRSF